MRVSVFGDVHGNLVALETFVAATQDIVDAYLCLGDVVDYGPWNDDCLEIVLQLPGIRVLEGNHERLFAGAESVDHESALAQAFFRRSRQFFSRGDLIAGLPLRAKLGLFECVHTIDGRYIYRDSPIDIACDYMVGHTHHQFTIDRSGFVIVNPGSVGQNREWIDMVDFLILDTESGEVQMHAVPYNVDQFLSELRLRHYPEECVRYYASKPRKAV